MSHSSVSKGKISIFTRVSHFQYIELSKWRSQLNLSFACVCIDVEIHLFSIWSIGIKPGKNQTCFFLSANMFRSSFRNRDWRERFFYVIFHLAVCCEWSSLSELHCQSNFIDFICLLKFRRRKQTYQSQLHHSYLWLEFLRQHCSVLILLRRTLFVVFEENFLIITKNNVTSLIVESEKQFGIFINCIFHRKYIWKLTFSTLKWIIFSTACNNWFRMNCKLKFYRWIPKLNESLIRNE